MLLTAAQIVGLPYYAKNTRAIYNSLRPLLKEDVLEEGDLIWYEGHVLVVSDIPKNFVIEAVGYESGFAKVHQISLDKVFADIHDYKDLILAHHMQQPLKRLDILGNPVRSVQQLKLFKLI